MSEHLHYIPISPAAAATPAPGTLATPADAPEGLAGVFAALLEQAGIRLPDGDAPAGPVADPGIPAPVAPPGVPGAAAAVITPQEIAADPHAVLKDFVDALKALQTALDAGDPPDPALLDRLDKDADVLADVLGVPQEQKPELSQTLGALAGIAAAVLAPALSPLVAAATPALSPLIAMATPALKAAVEGPAAPVAAPPAPSGLPAKLEDLAARLAPADAPLAAKLSALGDRLGSAKAAPEAIAQLGLGATAAPDPDLQSALQTLLADKPAAANPAARPAPSGPAFAPTQLPVPDDTALTARKGAEPEIAPAGLDEPAPEGGGKPAPRIAMHRLPAEADKGAKPAAAPHSPPVAAVAAAAEKAAEPAASTASPPSTPATPAITQAQAPAAVPKPLPAAYQTPQVNLPQLAFEIARQVQQGTSRFQIRLDPPELGRIDVRMDVDGGGNLNARLTVERTETLDLLQRDHRGLERALAQAGVDGAKTNLEFSLKQNPFERPQGGPFVPVRAAPESSEAGADIPIQSTVTIYRGTASTGGVNIFV